MLADRRISCRYLVPPKNAFWQWQDDGDVATWADGRTIAFRAELLEIMNHLAPNGLPPLGAILLLLAATRDNWCEMPNDMGILAGCLKQSESAWKRRDTLNVVIAKLERVHRLDPEVRTTSVAKSVLAEVVFDRSAVNLTAETSAAVVLSLAYNMAELLDTLAEFASSTDDGPTALLRDLKCLQSGLDRVDPEVLKTRRVTGLDELPAVAELELPPAQRVRALLAELELEHELSGLAKLAQNLMAAVALPRAVTDCDELQLGGISDITNRGPLDRLLLSELAHDDLTLAVRVAVNEALYLRRESPPRTPPRQRDVFLEVGIRSWGVPRVFATAVALALAATAEGNTELLVYRAKGNGVEPVDLTSRDGLLEHLAALEPELHPGRALEAFRREVAKADDAAEPILVTTDAVLNDKQFQQALVESDAFPLHLASVNRDGRFQLIERTARGSKLIREATLDLDGLFTSRARDSTTLIDRDWARDLPAIFSVDPFPLLLPHSIDPNRMWSVEGRGVLALTKDRRLMVWTRANCGAQQVADNVPRGALWWSASEAVDGKVRAVVGHMAPDGLHLLDIDLEQLRCTSMHLKLDRGARGICSHNGVLFAVFPQHVQIIAENTGEVIQTLALPTGMVHQRDRFFLDSGNRSWHVLHYDGRTAGLQQVVVESEVDCPELLTLFERRGTDGPIGVTVRGDLFMTNTMSVRKVHHDMLGTLRVRAIAGDGRSVVLETSSIASPGRKTAAIDVATLQASWLNSNDHDWGLHPEFGAMVRPTNIRHRFTHVCITKNGQIALISRKHHHLCIEYVAKEKRILLGNKTEAIPRASSLSFSDVPIQDNVGFRLSRATWHDGSEAFLDSRGLLHLRSSDKSVPEVSIVLRDGALAGWCSDGRLWGTRYFIGQQESAAQREVFETTIKAFIERLP